MRQPKLAVIGASHFQLPLIEKAREKGCEVHAFAWECGDVGEAAADVFHPVSIVDVDLIVEECRRIGIDGICTIASDLATVAVCHVAAELGLTGNSLECLEKSTNKGAMRQAFAEGGDPSPKSMVVPASQVTDFGPARYGFSYPIIVKPTDRSGSRGVTKLETPDAAALDSALRQAIDQGFADEVIVEEFAEGDEFSVEGLTWEGVHHILAITRKGTTGAPHFIETSHLQPAGLDSQTAARVEAVVAHALDTLGVRNGASHSELKIAADGTIRIIEIGARMGGDCIGSHLVPLSTGIDFVGAVVDVALGRQPDLSPRHEPAAAAIRFLFNDDDRRILERVRAERPDIIRYVYMTAAEDAPAHEVTDSSTRLGHFVMSTPDIAELLPFLPGELQSELKDAPAARFAGHCVKGD